LLRYPSADFMLWFYSRRIQNLLTVHHTIEEAEFKLYRWSGGFLRWISEKLLGRSVLSNVLGIIAVTPEIAQYELRRTAQKLPSFLYLNGDMPDTNEQLQDNRGGHLKAVFVANSGNPWNGLDLAISTLCGRSDIELHIVGPLGISRPGLENTSNVYCHGCLDECELNDLLSQMDVGISTLAISRKGMREACPLRARKYLQQGLPVVGNYIDPGFPSTFPYFRSQPLCVTQLLDYAREMRQVEKIKIRESAQAYIDKYAQLENLIIDLSHKYEHESYKVRLDNTDGVL
jgi:hypothetical protein